jgi:hypothetical protein
VESGLLGRLEEVVRVHRGRMGQYEVSDFVLLLNSYAISGEKTLKAFYQAIAPVKEVLMSVWGRSRCPAASTMSRFLAVIDRVARRENHPDTVTARIYDTQFDTQKYGQLNCTTSAPKLDAASVSSPKITRHLI